MKNIRFKKLPLILIVVSIVFIGSCVKDNFDYKKLTTNNLEWKPNIAVPVAFAYLNMRDLLQDYDTMELVVEDGTGLLYIMYESRVASITAENMMNMSNQNYSQSILVPDLSIVGNQFYAKKDVVNEFAVTNNERIDSLVLKTCDLGVSVTSTFLHSGLIKFTFPTFVKNGQQLVINIPLSNSGNFSSNQNLNLKDYHMNLTQGTPAYNKLPYTVELWLDDSSSPVQGMDNIQINFDFSTINFSSIYGYLGKHNINMPLDTIALDMNVNALAGNAYFENPKFRIKLYNSFGMEVQVQINNLSAYSNVYHNSYNLNLPQEYSPLLINGPGLNQIGQSVLTEMLLTKSNSNLQSIMGYLPRYMFYSVAAQTNPNADQNPNLQSNFVLDTSRVDVDVEVELPLWGNAKYLVLQDTATFDVSSFFDDLKPIDWVLFRTNITNGFPTEVGVQGYFTDSLYNVVDSLFERQTEFISSGQLDSEGKVIKPTLRTTDILFPKKRIQKLENVKYVLFRGYASTTNNAIEVVKMYNYYGVDVQLALQAQFTINQNQADTLLK